MLSCVSIISYLFASLAAHHPACRQQRQQRNRNGRDAHSAEPYNLQVCSESTTGRGGAGGGMTRASRLAKERVDRPDARPPACGAAAWAQEGWSVRLWIGVGPLREERREGGGLTGRRPSKPDMSAARRSRECRRPSPPARPPFVVPSFDVGSRSTLSRPSLSMTSHI